MANASKSATTVSTETIRELIASWRKKVDGFEHALATVDRMEEAGAGLSDPRSSKLISQARQNQLEDDINELERILP
jgi:hypothetical protein